MVRSKKGAAKRKARRHLRLIRDRYERDVKDKLCWEQNVDHSCVLELAHKYEHECCCGYNWSRTDAEKK